MSVVVSIFVIHHLYKEDEIHRLALYIRGRGVALKYVAGHSYVYKEITNVPKFPYIVMEFFL